MSLFLLILLVIYLGAPLLLLGLILWCEERFPYGDDEGHLWWEDKQ